MSFEVMKKLESRNEKGQTPILLAAELDKIELVRQLVDQY
jgi:hypothetical protein